MDLNGFALAEVVAMPFTPLAVTLGKGSEAHVPHTVHIPKAVAKSTHFGFRPHGQGCQIGR